GRSYRGADAPARPDARRDGGYRSCAALGRSRPRDPPGRYRLDPARGEALARRSAKRGDDTRRARRGARGPHRGLGGAGQRRAIRGTGRTRNRTTVASGQWNGWRDAVEGAESDG